MDDGHSRQFDTVLFDLDGVITSEYAYWKAAALTVYEYFHDDLELNSEYCYENADAITDQVFSYQETIVTMKSLGINSNWDLAYAVVLVTDILKSEGLEEEDDVFSRVPEFLTEKNVLAPELLTVLAQEYEEIFNYPEGYAERGKAFYQEIIRKFQHWYLGDTGYQKQYQETAPTVKGDSGLLDSEEPLLGLSETKAMLETLKQRGYHLGIGSGRPKVELERPLSNWGVLSLFDSHRIVSYDDVLLWQDKAEESLVKPHPFQFVKGAVGQEFTMEHLCNFPDCSRVLVVGDALCDLLAAHAAGCKFCAVLTGVDGKDARLFFENMGADYILEDATHLPEILV
ncbi:MAG: HAD family hydrolase [Clostridia bacterium]|nr:HAD family hydrolase [Clostridia bacterium]